MRFEWDDDKRLKVLRERGVDFIDAAAVFDNPVYTWRDGRDHGGEERLISIGFVDSLCLVVVYTMRGDVIRLITAWKGGRNDRAKYDARFNRPDQGNASQR